MVVVTAVMVITSIQVPSWSSRKGEMVMDRESGALVLSAATASMVVGIFQTASPGIANVRVSEAGDKDLAAS